MISDVYGLRLLRKPVVRRSILLLVVGVVVVFRAAQFVSLTNDARWALDFSYYWTAGLHVLHGEPIYSAQQLGGLYVPEGQEGFLYPPPLAVLVAPLAALFPADYRAAGWIWAAIGALLLVASVAAIHRREGLQRRLVGLPAPTLALLLVAAFALPPVIGELTVGNVHLEILGLLSVAWLGIRRGGTTGDAFAGAAIGAAAMLKVFPALLVVWLLATGRWRAAVWSAVAALVIAVLSLPATGLQAWLDYPMVVLNMGPVGNIHDSVSPTLWLEPVIGFAVARWVVLAAAAVLTIVVARRQPTGLSYAFAVGASVLIAPAVFHHYLAVFVLPMLLALAGNLSLRWVVASYLLMWGGQQPALGEWAWVLSRVPQTLGWLVLMVGLAVGRPSDSRIRERLVAVPAR